MENVIKQAKNAGKQISEAFRNLRKKVKKNIVEKKCKNNWTYS